MTDDVTWRCKCGWVGELGHLAFLHRDGGPEHNPTPILKQVKTGIEKELSAKIIQIPRRVS